ncbi:MAG: hypothetical protein Q9181_006095, partial [Wetmoreana brouardii]
MAKAEDYVCPWNDSSIYVMTESSVFENNEAAKIDATAHQMPAEDHCLEAVTSSEDSTLPRNPCQALVLYKKLGVNGPGPKAGSMTESEPNVTPIKLPTFRDSITLRHEQLDRDRSDKDR